MDQPGITRIINLAKDAVDKSTFGPFFQYPDKTNITKREINQLCWMVFASIMPVMVAEELARERIKNDKPPVAPV